MRSDDLLGATVEIDHGGGLRTLYANLQSETRVETGDYVTAGQPIGAVGATALGESGLPPHLHFAVTQDGEAVDPEEFLR